MTQNFKSKLDSLLDNDDDISTSRNEENSVTHHGGPAYARVLLIVFPNGDESFWHYSYLIKADFEKSSGSIVLSFTSDVITLKGLRLHALYRDFSRHEPHVLTVIDPRYDGLGDGRSPIINAVEVIPK